jgi:hypothetical protein
MQSGNVHTGLYRHAMGEVRLMHELGRFGRLVGAKMLILAP